MRSEHGEDTLARDSFHMSMPKNPRRVLVTGAAGWIGSHLVARLVEDETEPLVYAMVRTSARPDRLRSLLPRIHIVECDLDDLEATKTTILRIRPDICYHLAWFAVPSEYLASSENLRSLVASLNLLQALQAAKSP